MEFNHALWGEVVPDGPDYCHWGGRAQSQLILQYFEPNQHDKVLEICCGRGGTLHLINNTSVAYGVDLSYEAVRYASSQGLLAVQADARSLPFADKSFTRILSQDADAWMSDHRTLAEELRRVAAPNCTLVLQTYARSEKQPAHSLEETSMVLRQCGYTDCCLPVVEQLPQLLVDANWSIGQVLSLGELYTQDNVRMIERAKKKRQQLERRFGKTDVDALLKLLVHEQQLFAQNLWTGLLIVAHAT